MKKEPTGKYRVLKESKHSFVIQEYSYYWNALTNDYEYKWFKTGGMVYSTHKEAIEALNELRKSENDNSIEVVDDKELLLETEHEKTPTTMKEDKRLYGHFTEEECSKCGFRGNGGHYCG